MLYLTINAEIWWYMINNDTKEDLFKCYNMAPSSLDVGRRSFVVVIVVFGPSSATFEKEDIWGPDGGSRRSTVNTEINRWKEVSSVNKDAETE